MRAAHHTDTADAGFWPVTRSGAWSLGLMALAALAMVSSMVAVAAGQRGGDTPADNWVLSSLAAVMGAGVLGALISGVYSITRRHERAVAVLMTTLLGLLGALFLIGELAVPH